MAKRKTYKPPYELRSSYLKTVGTINKLIGQLEGYGQLTGNLKLRRENKIKSVLSSVAIEGNRLTVEQVSAILDGKRVWGPAQDIQEVMNALKVYNQITTLDAYNEDDLLSSHADLMAALIPDAGRYRSSNIGVMDGPTVIHLGPPPLRVPQLMGDLFDYLQHYDEEILVKSCVFHYEFEFIHPFSDGNGRMGRLWQTVILMREHPILQFVPFENIVHRRQEKYYQALQDSQSVGSSDPFIEFMLNALQTALEEEVEKIGDEKSENSRITAFLTMLKEPTFTRADYRKFHRNVSPATATRDLNEAVDDNLISVSGNTKNRRYTPNT